MERRLPEVFYFTRSHLNIKDFFCPFTILPFWPGFPPAARRPSNDFRHVGAKSFLRDASDDSRACNPPKRCYFST